MRSPQVLSAELRRVRGEILHILVRPAGDWEKTDPQVARVERQLRAIVRELEQQENFAGMQKWNAAPMTQARWGAQQKEKESREVLTEAMELQREVARMLGPNAMEVAKDAVENLHDLQELFGHHMQAATALSHAPGQPVLMPQQSAGTQGGDPAVIAIVWVVLALEWWKKHKSKSQAAGRA